MKPRSFLVALTLATLAAAPLVQAQVPITGSQPALIIMSDGQSDLVRLLVTNERTIGAWKAGTEYWYGAKDLGELGTEPLQWTVKHFGSDVSEKQIAAALGDFSLSFSAPQEVGTKAWSVAGKPASCAGQTLYQTTDPDKPSVQIGVLLRQDEQTGSLAGSTLFKTFNTGRIFDVLPEQLKLVPVLSAAGKPSCDPGDIASVPWYQFSAGTK